MIARRVLHNLHNVSGPLNLIGTSFAATRKIRASIPASGNWQTNDSDDAEIGCKCPQWVVYGDLTQRT